MKTTDMRGTDFRNNCFRNARTFPRRHRGTERSIHLLKVEGPVDLRCHSHRLWERSKPAPATKKERLIIEVTIIRIPFASFKAHLPLPLIVQSLPIYVPNDRIGTIRPSALATKDRL
jgi:hypothetical protein